MHSTSIPPFPEDVPTHPLVVVDFQKVKARDQDELAKLWDAARSLGFWYLKNHGVSEDADAMFDLGASAMALPLSEKMKYEQGDEGNSAGYKAVGGNAVDATGRPDLAEFFNLSTDDVLKWPQPGRRSYPKVLEDRFESTVAPFVRQCIYINSVHLDVFNEKLELPLGSLSGRHLLEAPSPSETRITHTPPTPQTNQVAIGGHTDFGSLTIVCNRLGGLQVLAPGSDVWQYVKPLPGHVICNIGDALSLFSGGILRSNTHRVVSPPGNQADHERWSLAYFTRPGNTVQFRPLMDESQLIASFVNAQPDHVRAKLEASSGETAEEWFTRRIKNQRLKNRKGPETWAASRGTELQPAKA